MFAFITFLNEAKLSVATLDKKFAWRRESGLSQFSLCPRSPRSKVQGQKGFSLDSLQQSKREKCGPEDCYDKQRSDGFEQLWSLSYSMEVKRGPGPRRWRKVSMDSTPECCEPLNVHWQQPINNQEQYGSLPSEDSAKNAGRLSWPLCLSQWRDCFKSAALETSTWSLKSRRVDLNELRTRWTD